MGIINLLYNQVTKKDKQSVNTRYGSAFIKTMYRHHEKLIERLVSDLTNKEKTHLKILDLSEMGGELIASLIRRNIDAEYTLVDQTKANLGLAKARLGEEITYIEEECKEFLSTAQNESYDIIICMGTFKSMTLRAFIRESKRVIKPNGKVVVLIGLKDSMPELKRLCYKVLVQHPEKITKLIPGIPYPSSRKEVEKTCMKGGFRTIVCGQANQVFGFASGKRLVRWLADTGMLEHYKEMLDLRNKQVRESFIKIVEEEQVEWITHKFVYGIWEKN